MSANDWTEVVGAVGVFTLITVVISVTVVQLSRTVRAKAALARESEYRKLAESSTGAQVVTEQRLAGLAGQVGQIQERLTAIENILRQVE